MSRLREFSETDPNRVLFETAEHCAIAQRLATSGIRFERWQAAEALPPGASQDEVVAAFRGDIDRLLREADYKAYDVVSLHPEHPDRASLRRKFLDEHTHAEDEVRFFVAGGGLFSLHLGDRVLEVLCEQGDLIAVPDGTRHWFDMGPQPYFIAIRIFSNAAGWVANFTGDDIGARFPRYG